MSGVFDDVLAANEDYVRTFTLAGLQPVAARGLALVTCMDSRIEPLEMLGLKPGTPRSCGTRGPGSPTTPCGPSSSRCTCWG